MIWKANDNFLLIYNCTVFLPCCSYLVKWLELDVVGWFGSVGEGSGERVEVVGADGDEGPLSGQVLVKLVLRENKYFIQAKST